MKPRCGTVARAAVPLRDCAFRMSAVRLITSDFVPGSSCRPDRNLEVRGIPSCLRDEDVANQLSQVHHARLRGRLSLTWIELQAALATLH